MVIFLEFNVIFLIFLAIVFFITLGILSKWFHDFYHTKFTIYPGKPMQLDMKRYKNLLIRISIFYIANNIVSFFLWGRTPFVYLFFYLTTIYEFVAINIYHSFSKIDGKMLYDKNDIKNIPENITGFRTYCFCFFQFCSYHSPLICSIFL